MLPVLPGRVVVLLLGRVVALLVLVLGLLVVVGLLLTVGLEPTVGLPLAVGLPVEEDLTEAPALPVPVSWRRMLPVAPGVLRVMAPGVLLRRTLAT